MRALPRLTTTMEPSRRTLHLTVKVTAPDVSAVDGDVGVRLRGVLLKTFHVKNGTGWTTLHIASGSQPFRIHFRGSPTVDMSTVWQRVRIP